MIVFYGFLLLTIAGALITLLAMMKGFKRLPSIANLKSRGILKVRLLIMFILSVLMILVAFVNLATQQEFVVIACGIVLFIQSIIALLAFTEADYLDNRWQALLQNTPDLVLNLDRGVITFASKEFHGYTATQLTGQVFMNFFEPEQQKMILETCSTSDISKGMCTTQISYVAPGSKDLQYFFLRVKPISANGELTDLVVILTDITNKVRTAEQLARTEKMSSLSRLATAVGHEFNNSLTVILAFMEEVKDFINDAEFLKLAGQAEISAKKAADLANQLATFGYKQTVEEDAIDLNQHLNKLVPKITEELGPSINFSLINSPGKSVIKIDPNLLAHAISIIAVNAKKAMPTGGDFSISIVNRYREHQFTPFFDIASGNYAVIILKDSGPGLSDVERERVFEPSFDHNDGKAFHVGLAAVYNIAQRFEGDISITSTPKDGTTISLAFPLVKNPVTVEEKEHDSSEKSILLVEDEEPLRLICANMLRKIGYTVIEAKNGQEAVDTINSLNKPVSLLLTDILMPIMNGKDSAQIILKKYPDLAVIYMSGFVGDISLQKEEHSQGFNFLQKPFTPKELREKISNAFSKSESKK